MRFIQRLRRDDEQRGAMTCLPDLTEFCKRQELEVLAAVLIRYRLARESYGYSTGEGRLSTHE
jgi:hypothetical protein